MYTIKNRCRDFDQPIGGFVSNMWFNQEVINPDDGRLNKYENVSGEIVSTVVRNLAKMIRGIPKEEAFEQSLRGAAIVDHERSKGKDPVGENLDDKCIAKYHTLKDSAKLLEAKRADQLLNSLGYVDCDKTVTNACKLVCYDRVVFAGVTGLVDIDKVMPDKNTIKNIRKLVKRLASCYKAYSPVINESFTFEDEAAFKSLTEIVSPGVNDCMLTEDTLWSVIIKKTNVRPSLSLELLSMYILGTTLHPEVFENITTLGVVNPRTNKTFTLEIDHIPDDIIEVVKYGVLGFDMSDLKDTPESRFTFDKRQGKITGCKLIDSDNDHMLKIPETIGGVAVKVIGEKVFKGGNLIRVSLPDTIESIEPQAFKDNDIEMLSLPANLRYANTEIFDNNKLKLLTFGNVVKLIDVGAFSNNDLDDVVFNNGGIQIKEYAFIKNNIKSVEIYEDTSTSDLSFGVSTKVVRINMCE